MLPLANILPHTHTVSPHAYPHMHRQTLQPPAAPAHSLSCPGHNPPASLAPSSSAWRWAGVK